MVQGSQGVTPPFFELQTSDFARKFIWNVLTNYDKKLVRWPKNGVNNGQFLGVNNGGGLGINSHARYVLKVW